MTERHPLDIVGGRIADIQNRILMEADVLNATKAQMTFNPTAYERPRRGSAMGIAAAAAAAVVAFGLFSLVWDGKDAQDISVSVDGAALAAGEWISTSGNEETALEFSDTSTVTLHAQSGLRIQALNPRGAHLLLERGRLDADVFHRKGTAWQLDVGPYSVDVTGTRFTASWNPETEVFTLAMTEGTVDVSGPMISSGKSLETGETMIASLASGRLEFLSGKTRRTAEAAQVPDVITADGVSEAPSVEDPNAAPAGEDLISATKTAKGKSHPRPRAWERAASSKDFEGVVRAVKKTGVQTAISTASSDDLLTLGDAARHTGNTALASKFYRAARTRYDGTPQAVRATFSLGIMAFDQKGAYLEAAKWFSRIAQSSNKKGLLVKEASGRLIEALHKGGDAAGAEAAAERYLRLYPNGPHAALAKRLTQ